VQTYDGATAAWSTKTTHYYYDGWSVVEETDAAGNLTASYLNGRDLDEPLAAAIPGVNNGAPVCFHQNPLGNVELLTDAQGTVLERYRYDLQGNVTVLSADGTPTGGGPETALSPYLFTGRRFDAESGLYYVRNRYYSPLLGKFISPDPLDYVDGMNVYAYVNGNTANLVDPMGTHWDEEDERRLHPDSSSGNRSVPPPPRPLPSFPIPRIPLRPPAPLVPLVPLLPYGSPPRRPTEMQRIRAKGVHDADMAWLGSMAESAGETAQEAGEGLKISGAFLLEAMLYEDETTNYNKFNAVEPRHTGLQTGSCNFRTVVSGSTDETLVGIEISYEQLVEYISECAVQNNPDGGWRMYRDCAGFSALYSVPGVKVVQAFIPVHPDGRDMTSVEHGQIILLSISDVSGMGAVTAETVVTSPKMMGSFLPRTRSELLLMRVQEDMVIGHYFGVMGEVSLPAPMPVVVERGSNLVWRGVAGPSLAEERAFAAFADGLPARGPLSNATLDNLIESINTSSRLADSGWIQASESFEIARGFGTSSGTRGGAIFGIRPTQDAVFVNRVPSLANSIDHAPQRIVAFPGSIPADSITSVLIVNKNGVVTKAFVRPKISIKPGAISH
jgi:RHS repeat-associated protein